MGNNLNNSMYKSTAFLTLLAYEGLALRVKMDGNELNGAFE